ncbi:putative ferulic acid esterase (FaeA) [Planoprotostelium fungivorum]|uniref:Putative ferulic acid esterase (FaeA) n=1 Tax=Planoprotostelium fungivorum TaxID=1890364 RepID=A0A2P6NQC4_9EUKA|nr:putative ferulic acid esterase (FaeA) [Planoprotostelium fungivorum]
MKKQLILAALLLCVGADVTCPSADGNTWSVSDRSFRIRCGVNHAGVVLSTSLTHSFEDCLQLCSLDSRCVGINHSGSVCHLKSSIDDTLSIASKWSAASLVASTRSRKTKTRSSTKTTITASSTSPLPTSSLISGCGASLPKGMKPGGPSQTFSIITADGRNRTYILYIPTQYASSTPSPLIFGFHGLGANSHDIEQQTRFSQSKVNVDHIAVYPDGWEHHWEGAPYSTPKLSDVSFVEQLLHHLQGQLCIDTRRVYATGHSNGGGFTGTLACNPSASNFIAAFAAHSGAFYQATKPSPCQSDQVLIRCQPSRPLPFMEIHGDKDPQIPYLGGVHNGECMPSVPHYVSEWGIRNKDTENEKVQLPQGNVRYTWGKKDRVVHIMVKGLDHSWANQFHNFTAGPVILDFFRKWSL